MREANRTWRRGISAFAFAVALANSAVAAPGDIFAEFYGSEVSWAEGEYVGHAFACIILQLNAGIKEDCYGFYPKQGGKGLIGGPGLTASEAKKNPSRFSRIDTTIKYKISEEQRREILRLVDIWNSKDYALTTANCIDFVHEAAGKTGLTRPDRTKFQLPSEYMRELDKLN